VVKIDLNELTAIIKQRAASIQLSFWDIGKDLNFIQEKKIFKEKHKSLKDYIEGNFSFSYDHARKMMFVTGKYSRVVAETIGITKLYLLLQVPETYRDEVIELVKDKKIDREGLRKQVKRFKGQSGSKPSYSSNKEEHLYSLKRQFSTLCEQHTDVIQDLNDSWNSWISQTLKHSDNELKQMRLKALEKLEEI